MASGAERAEAGDSDQDEEDVYEVERIIDMRVEEVSECGSRSGCHLVSDVASSITILCKYCI